MFPQSYSWRVLSLRAYISTQATTDCCWYCHLLWDQQGSTDPLISKIHNHRGEPWIHARQWQCLSQVAMICLVCLRVYMPTWITDDAYYDTELRSSTQPPSQGLICTHPYPWNVSKPWQQVPWLWCWQGQSSPLMLEVLDPKEQCVGCGLVQFLILGMLL